MGIISHMPLLLEIGALTLRALWKDLEAFALGTSPTKVIISYFKPLETVRRPFLLHHLHLQILMLPGHDFSCSHGRLLSCSWRACKTWYFLQILFVSFARVTPEDLGCREHTVDHGLYQLTDFTIKEICSWSGRARHSFTQLSCCLRCLRQTLMKVIVPTPTRLCCLRLERRRHGRAWALNRKCAQGCEFHQQNSRLNVHTYRSGHGIHTRCLHVFTCPFAYVPECGKRCCEQGVQIFAILD